MGGCQVPFAVLAAFAEMNERERVPSKLYRHRLERWHVHSDCDMLIRYEDCVLVRARTTLADAAPGANRRPE